jgi:hypothetical protein
VYVDGTEIDRYSVATSIISGSSSLFIGQRYGYSERFQGIIDEVAIYNRALSAAEVGRVYRMAGRLTTESVRAKSGGLVGHWSFDNDDGDTVIDSSPNGNHGRLKTAIEGTAITKWLSQADVSKLLNEADSFAAQMDQAKEREDWTAVDVGAQTLWYVLRKLKTTTPGITPRRKHIETSSILSFVDYSQYYAREVPDYGEGVPELDDCISKLEELCDDLHSTIRDKKMSLVPEIYKEFSKQWTRFNSITQFKLGADKSGPTLTDGITGKAYSLDGVDDYIDLGSENSLKPNHDDVTYAAWFKTNHSGTIQQIMRFSAGTGWGQDGCYQLFVDADGNITASVRRRLGKQGSEGNSATVIGQNVTDNRWHFAAFTWDFSTLTIEGFLDSSSIGKDGLEAGWQDHLDQSGRTFSIGVEHYRTGDINYFSGVIDEVRIYNRALSADEIAQLYQEGLN